MIFVYFFKKHVELNFQMIFTLWSPFQGRGPHPRRGEIRRTLVVQGVWNEFGSKERGTKFLPPGPATAADLEKY